MGKSYTETQAEKEAASQEESDRVQGNKSGR